MDVPMVIPLAFQLKICCGGNIFISYHRVKVGEVEVDFLIIFLKWWEMIGIRLFERIFELQEVFYLRDLNVYLVCLQLNKYW